MSNYLLVYGSLLSEDSRKRYSDLPEASIPIILNDWQRAWATRSIEEKQTYVGARPKKGHQLNGCLVEFAGASEALAKREQDYQFVKIDKTLLSAYGEYVDPEQLGEVWICQSLAWHEANEAFPIHASYLNTCLQGCLDIATAEFATAFMDSTQGLEHYLVDDKCAPKYPRAASLNEQQASLVFHFWQNIHLLK